MKPNYECRMIVDGEDYEFDQSRYDDVMSNCGVAELHRMIINAYMGYRVSDLMRLPKYKLAAMVAATYPAKDKS